MIDPPAGRCRTLFPTHATGPTSSKVIENEAAHKVGCVWVEGHCWRTLIVAATKVSILDVLVHLDAQARLEITCCCTFEPHTVIFRARIPQATKRLLVGQFSCLSRFGR